MKTCRICNQTKPADAYRGTRSGLKRPVKTIYDNHQMMFT